MSLRASSNKTIEDGGSLEDRLSEDAQWEEDPGWTLMGPGVDVKGGVELYPLQAGRRPRKANPPIVPNEDEIEGVFTAWMFPDVYEDGGGNALKGLYVLFHGCQHEPRDWFDLPEERAIVSFLLEKNYAVLAPRSQNTETGCWNSGVQGDDVNSVRRVLWKFYRTWSIPPDTPLFLFGASSGGRMATALGKDGGFQLCEKRTTYIAISGILSQVSWGIEPSRFEGGLSPIAFISMEKGERDETDSFARRNAPPVFGPQANVPDPMVNIAHAVRKKGGKPRMLYLPLGEIQLYDKFFSDRVYEISVEESRKLYSALVAAYVLECKHHTNGDPPECRLPQDPRRNPVALDTLVTTYAMGSSDHPSQVSEVGPDASRMSTEHAKKVFEELLNVAWGAHELSAEFTPIWENWLFSSCGDRCSNWYGGDSSP